ncbi:MAG: hypothetical protein R2911_17445 [Caldilineaceae bacterium]
MTAASVTGKRILSRDFAQGLFILVCHKLTFLRKMLIYDKSLVYRQQKKPQSRRPVALQMQKEKCASACGARIFTGIVLKFGDRLWLRDMLSTFSVNERFDK